MKAQRSQPPRDEHRTVGTKLPRGQERELADRAPLRHEPKRSLRTRNRKRAHRQRSKLSRSKALYDALEHRGDALKPRFGRQVERSVHHSLGRLYGSRIPDVGLAQLDEATSFAKQR